MNHTFESDAKAFLSIEPILTFRAFQIIRGFNLLTPLVKGATLDELMRLGNLKNRKMFECLLNFLVGRGALKQVDSIYFFLQTPKYPSQESFKYLYDGFYGSMEWLDCVSMVAPGILASDQALTHLGFGEDADLEMWDTIMSESPYAFRQHLLEKLLVGHNCSADFSFLDFGCGGGVGIIQTLSSLKKEIKITGLDLSPPYLDRAKKKIDVFVQSSKKPAVIRSKVTLQKFNFKTDTISEKFDSIFVSLVFNHLTEDERFQLLIKLSSMLKKDGLLGIYQIVNQTNYARSPLCWVMHTVPSHKCYPERQKFVAQINSVFSKVEELFNGNGVIAQH